MNFDNETGFKVKFNTLHYKDVWKVPPPDLEEIINFDKPEHQCIWKRVVPDVITESYKRRELTRVLKTGVWIYIKRQPIWIPPSYYFFLQYFRLGTTYPQFRLKRLKQLYHKLRVRNNPRAIGTYTIKNRQDGETTMSMSDCLWEAAFGNMDFGAIGIQSKTRDTVIQSCWRVITIGWNGMDKWIKDILYPDFQSGDKIAEKMKFNSPAKEGFEGRDVLLTYGASSENGFDSMNNMRRCVLDEINKWEECSFYSTFLNYKKFIAAGTERKGLFDIFSSPAQTAGKHNDEAFKFWQGSDPDKLTDAGSTETRVFRYYSDPREGIEGMYDEYGDADADDIMEFILNERKSVPKEHLMAEIRALPLNEHEMFGSTDEVSIWQNTEGIIKRSQLLKTIRFKDEISKEPISIFGNLEWRDGIVDSDVDFRMTDKNAFDVSDARFCFSYLPQQKDELKRYNERPLPPVYTDFCIGIDPVNKRHATKNATKLSNLSMVLHKFRDILESGIVKCPTAIYCCRPQHAETAYEDAIKLAVFSRSMVQVENLTDKIIDYFEDRGYLDWMLSKIGQPRNSLVKGDAPSGGRNAFLDEMIGLIDAITNTPLTPMDKYHLEQVWFPELLDDLVKFNPKDTHSSDLSMAWGQALIGALKMLYRKVRTKQPEMASALDFLLG